MRVFLHPEPDQRPDAMGNGIEQVVRAMYAHLPDHGIELTSSVDGADLIATHVDSNHGIPDVLHCHGLYSTGEIQLGAWAWKVNGRILLNARQAKAVTVPSAFVSEIFARNLGFRPSLIPHGIEPDEWPEPSTRSELIVLWNKNRPSDVCSVEPLERLAQLRPNVKFISTFGGQRPNLEVTGTMPHPDMKELLYRCGVYYAPTKETFGIGILEAMAAGMPVLAWNWGNAPSLVEHMVTGYIVEPYDYLGATRGLDWCLEHFSELSPKARERALTFTWDASIRAYAELYQSVVTGKALQKPMVSVVMPSYNYAAYIAEAIQSVKAQTMSDWECIIVDDGSTDTSLEVIKQTVADDSRFRVISQTNQKVAMARNRGAVASHGRYLCFLDADDYLLPEGLERLVSGMLSHEGLGIAYGKLRGTDKDSIDQGPHAWPDDFNMVKQLTKHNQIPSCCLIDPRAFFRAGGYRSHAIPAEDAELWTRIALLGFPAAKVTDEAIYAYRSHDSNATIGVHGSREPNWLAWLPAANGGTQPSASVAPSKKSSHPVYNYDKPLVSFITPVGPGHERLVFDAMESVEAQLDPRWEHIIVDDTEQGDLPYLSPIPYSISHPYVRWVRNPVLHNVSMARNVGARMARGRFICFLDADDMLFKEFLSETIPLMMRSPRSLIYTDWMELPEVKKHASEPWDPTKLLDHALFAVTFLHTKQAFLDVGGFDESLDVWEDWDYIVRLSFLGYTGFHVQKPLFSYRYHTGTRREESIAKAQERIQGLHLEAVAPSGASPAARDQTSVERLVKPPRRRPGQPPVTARKAFTKASQPPIGHTVVSYVGQLQQTRLFRTDSGRKYRFGPGHHEIKPVLDADVAFFTRLPDQFEVLPQGVQDGLS